MSGNMTYNFKLNEEELKILLEKRLKSFENNEELVDYLLAVINTYGRDRAIIKLGRILLNLDAKPKFKVGQKVLMSFNKSPSWRFSKTVSQESLLFKNCFRCVVTDVSLVTNEVTVTFSFLKEDGQLYTDSYNLDEEDVMLDTSDIEPEILSFLNNS